MVPDGTPFELDSSSSDSQKDQKPQAADEFRGFNQAGWKVKKLVNDSNNIRTQSYDDAGPLLTSKQSEVSRPSEVNERKSRVRSGTITEETVSRTSLLSSNSLRL